MKLATAEQMKELDRQAIEERGIPSIDLMERAGAAVAEAAAGLPAGKGRRRAAVLCGTGNNGGDGICAARHLFLRGTEVRVYLVGDYEKLTPDSREQTRRLSECGVALVPFDPEDEEQRRWILRADVCVDALFGVGLSRRIDPSSAWGRAVALMNDSHGAVVAADIASGVDATTGEYLGEPVHAVKTITFTLPKVGQLVGKGALCSGAVEVAGHRHPGAAGAGDSVSHPDGGAGLCPPGAAPAAGGRPQGYLRQGAGGGRRRGLYRCTVPDGSGRCAQRLRRRRRISFGFWRKQHRRKA